MEERHTRNLTLTNITLQFGAEQDSPKGFIERLVIVTLAAG